MCDLVIKEIETKSVLTKSNLPVADYSVNPYGGCAHACKYCYASFMKRFTGHEEEWGTFVDVKNWPDIKNPQKYAGKELFIGSVTDPYQPLEETYERTRTLLKQMQGSGCTISIATKSDLVVRDLDLIKTFPNARVSWSDAGVRTTCFISPIFPGITDIKEIILRAKSQCNLVWLENLNLRGGYKSVIMDYIKEKYPNLLPLYEDIYTKKDRAYWSQLDEEMRAFTKEQGLIYVRDDDSIKRPFEEPPIIVNYFFHEELTPSAKKAAKKRT